MRKKLRASMALLVIAGGAMAIRGGLLFVDAMRLKAFGETVEGEVVDAQATPSRPLTGYRLVVRYMTKRGQEHRQEFAVTEAAFDDARTSGSVQVTYLKDNTRVSTVPGHRQATWELAAIGGGLALLGLLLLVVLRHWRERGVPDLESGSQNQDQV